MGLKSWSAYKYVIIFLICKPQCCISVFSGGFWEDCISLTGVMWLLSHSQHAEALLTRMAFPGRVLGSLYINVSPKVYGLIFSKVDGSVFFRKTNDDN